MTFSTELDESGDDRPLELLIPRLEPALVYYLMVNIGTAFMQQKSGQKREGGGYVDVSHGRSRDTVPVSTGKVLYLGLFRPHSLVFHDQPFEHTTLGYYL